MWLDRNDREEIARQKNSAADKRRRVV